MNKSKKRKGKGIIILLLIVCSFIVAVYFLWPIFFKQPPVSADYSVSPPTVKPISNDFDNDGISNKDEILYGTNPFDPDSDDDGIIDGNETLWNRDVDGDGLINALDPDSDGDLLLDSLEDKNKNGILDAGETNVTNFDTDYDGLFDGLEDLNYNGIRDANESNPLDSDSDNDGLQDGSEPNWFEDTDGDGLINVLDPDSDDDLLQDGLEINIGSDPLDPDTDDDGIFDGLEYMKGLNVTNPDTDGDFLLDGEEAVIDAYWIEAETIAINSSIQVENDTEATNGLALQSLSNGSIIYATLFGNLTGGWYKLFIRTKCVNSFSSNPKIRIEINGTGGLQVAEEHLLPYVLDSSSNPANIYRWIYTQSFHVQENSSITLNITTTQNDVVRIDRLLFMRADTINFPRTDPLNNDTDGDGIIDGRELITASYWWEAEDFAYASSQIVDFPSMSNGKGVNNTADLKLCKIYDENFTYEPGPYAIFVRASKSNITVPTNHAWLNVTIKINYTDSTSVELVGKVDIWGNFLPPPYSRGRWTPVFFNNDKGDCYFNLNKSGTMSIEIILNTPQEPVILDKVVMMSIYFNRTRYSIHLYDYDVVPRALDPLDPDTDGDQYRIINGTLANSTGYLTDGFEMNLGLNPFDVDTDNDGMANVTPAYPFQDDVDPNPLSWDSDADGLFDWLEDRNNNLTWEPLLGETNWLDDDTDDDGILDSNEDWNYDGLNDIFETDPLNNDTDGDGILDGFEVGLLEPQGVGTNTTFWPNRNFTNSKPYVSDPLDWDSDDDGLPDGWIDFNNNSVKDPGEYEDRNCDGLIYIGPWNNGSGLGETNPRQADTDNDGLNDYEEIIERHSDPLTPDLPDFVISRVKYTPEQPLVEYSEFATAVTFEIDITNIGTVNAPRTYYDGANLMLEIRLKEYDNTQSENRLGFIRALGSLDAKQTRTFRTTVYLHAGFHNITIDVFGYYPKYYYFVKASEESYDNNVANIRLVVKGPPEAYAYLNSSYGVLDENNETTIEFYGWGKDADNNIANYSWDFDGDGIFDWYSSQSGNTTYMYTSAGVYFPVFKVVDKDGFSAEVSLVVSIIDPRKVDTDGDGLSDYDENVIGTNSTKADTDGDGLCDGYEIIIGSNPLDNDTDDDGLSDYLEEALMGLYGLNVSSKPDTDGDGIINILDSDSDNDGIADGNESRCVLPESPRNPSFWYGTNPYYSDTDYDGLDDLSELTVYNTSAVSPDTDMDALSDYDEIMLYHTDPYNADSDMDGVLDGYDAQPLIKGYAVSFTTVFLLGMIRYSSIVQIYGLKGEVWKKVLQDWESITADNVKSSTINKNTVLSQDWGDFEAEDATLINITNLGSLERTSGTYPDYKVKYTYQKYNYNVTYINPRPMIAEGYTYSLLPIAVSPNQNQSLVFQFSLSQDWTSIGESRYAILCFIYKLFTYDNVSFSGGRVVNITDYPVFEGFAPSVHLISNTYQVSLPIPREYTANGKLILFIQPIWYYKGLDVYTRPVPLNSIKFNGLQLMVQTANKVLTIGYPNVTTLNTTPSISHYLSPTSYTDKKIETSTILEYKENKYIVKNITITKCVEKTSDGSHIVLKYTVETPIGTTTNANNFEQLLPSGMEKPRYSKVIQKFKDRVVQSVSAAANKTSIIVIASVKEMLATLKYTYDGEAFPFEIQMAVTWGGVITDSVEWAIKVYKSKAWAQTIERASLVATIVICVIQTGILIWKASQTDDPHLHAYYAVSIILNIIETIIEAVLVSVLGPIGIAIVVIWELIKLIPQVQEAIENLKRGIVSEWEALTGAVPEEFARQIFKDACNKLIELAEQAKGVAIPILPKY